MTKLCEDLATATSILDLAKPDFLFYPFCGNELSKEEKIRTIEKSFRDILVTLGMDIEDDSIEQTPYRYAKMLVTELFEGLESKNFPKITTQANKFGYKNMLLQTNISIHSVCEHHFVPILGFCHIAYIPNEAVIGLSKLNRIAKYYARRPQVQERMTHQIKNALCSILKSPDVAVVVDALHLCVKMRGIQDQDALTRTISLGGQFLEGTAHQEFLGSVPKLKDFSL